MESTSSAYFPPSRYTVRSVEVREAPPDLQPGPWRKVLGFKPRSRPKLADIRAAHRKLALAHHPDRGGSHVSMAILNDARDRALESLA